MSEINNFQEVNNLTNFLGDTLPNKDEEETEDQLNQLVQIRLERK
jgi:hypothetical protein